MEDDVIGSPRFLTGKQLVRDLCIREKDYIQANRLLYMSVLKDAYNKLNLKTQFYTQRVAIPVDKSLNYIQVPANYLELSSISAPDDCGILQPMIINTKINCDVADLSLAKRCGCSCGCNDSNCASLSNFEVIYGTQDAVMPDNTIQTFTTWYRKVILKNGNYVEEQSVPVQNFQNNIHISTTLQTQSKLICNLDLLPCGCVAPTPGNQSAIRDACQSISVSFECGCTLEEQDWILLQAQSDAIKNGCPIKHEAKLVKHERYNMDEEGDRIYFPSTITAPYVVMRYWTNSKTKHLRIPYVCKEALMSQIKVMTTTFDKRSMREVEFWKQDFHEKETEMMENLTPALLSTFYDAVLGQYRAFDFRFFQIPDPNKI